MYTDKTLTCRDCGTSFVFTAGEQEFYASKGFANEPSRCAECRQNRNRSRDAGGYGGGYSAGGYGERRERQMYPVKCDQCGKDTQVPFLPRGDRPVYCSDCFDSQRRGSSVGQGSRW